ncbi:MAG: Holliday junction resolvase RecU [Clostridiaceae bacterium]|nr:Holliday junction resolvase RecU [Clostridiaceae bacterium]
MPSWNSRGLRGSVLEEAINITNEKYRQEKLALVQKIPTPITPIEIDPKKRHITLAYFDQKSTVDYIGTVQGIPVCFDAKECAKNVFPLQNIHAHQMQYMQEFEEQKGIAFFILYFSKEDAYYYVPFRDMKLFWERAKKGGRKSFRREELDASYQINYTNQIYIHYLEMLAKDLEYREEKASDWRKE